MKPKYNLRKRKRNDKFESNKKRKLNGSTDISDTISEDIGDTISEDISEEIINDEISDEEISGDEISDEEISGEEIIDDEISEEEISGEEISEEEIDDNDYANIGKILTDYITDKYKPQDKDYSFLDSEAYYEVKHLENNDKEIFNKFYNEILDDKLTINKILKSNMSESKKKKVLNEYLFLLKESGISTYDKFMIQNRLKNNVKNYEYSDEKTLRKSEELAKIIKFGTKKENLINRILNSNCSENNKAILYRRYKELIKHRRDSEEYGKCKNWINCALKIPNNDSANNFENIGEKLAKTMNYLDENLYGMNDVKEELMRIACNKMCGIKNNDIPVLIGDAGVGKTKLIQLLGECLDLPFHKISLGGIDDASYINGHHYTWVGSTAGQIVKALIEMGTNDGIIYFDEVDKIDLGKKNNSGSVSAALLHILDQTQNYNFNDNYLGSYQIDLSNIWFILSANDLNNIDRILRDRLHIINVSSYDRENKINIAKNFFFPKYLNSFGFLDGEIIYDDNICAYIVDKIGNKKSGVRELERAVKSIINKLHLSLIIGGKNIAQLNYIDNFAKPYNITTKTIDKLLISKEKDINTENNFMYS